MFLELMEGAPDLKELEQLLEDERASPTSMRWGAAMHSTACGSGSWTR